MSHMHHRQDGASLCEYFVGQVLTTMVAGSIGLVAILMSLNGQLGYILALQFHLPVLIAGFTLLGLAVHRAICVLLEVRHRHDREIRDHDCEHHEHGRSHDIYWVLARLQILLFPVGLFLIGVPNSGFSQDRIRILLGADDALTGNMAAVAHRNGTVTSLKELNEAAWDEGRRESLRGQTAILEGQIHRINASDPCQFTLFRMKMTCCAADIVPLKVRIVLKNGTLSGIEDFDWVEMKGQIQFVQAPNSDRYIPVIVVEDIRDLRKTVQPNIYE